jgi:hypothetical protein
MIPEIGLSLFTSKLHQQEFPLLCVFEIYAGRELIPKEDASSLSISVSLL